MLVLIGIGISSGSGSDICDFIVICTCNIIFVFASFDTCGVVIRSLVFID